MRRMTLLKSSIISLMTVMTAPLYPAEGDVEIASRNNYVILTVAAEDFTRLNRGDLATRAAVEKYANFLYRVLPDDYDFIFFVLDQPPETQTVVPFGEYHRARNDVLGIGLPLSRDTARFGSDGRLQGAVLLKHRDGLLLGPSLHELCHHWANKILDDPSLDDVVLGRDKDTGKAMLGRKVGIRDHWAFAGCGGQLGGFEQATLQENVDGQAGYFRGFRKGRSDWFGVVANGGNAVPYSNLELYLMGLIEEKGIEPFDVFSDISDYNDDGTTGRFRAGKRTRYDREKIVALAGKRIPDSARAQKEFRLLVAYVTATKPTWLLRSEWDIDVMTFTAPRAVEIPDFFNFWEATGGRARLVPEVLKEPDTTDFEVEMEGQMHRLTRRGAPGEFFGGPFFNPEKRESLIELKRDGTGQARGLGKNPDSVSEVQWGFLLSERGFLAENETADKSSSTYYLWLRWRRITPPAVTEWKQMIVDAVVDRGARTVAFDVFKRTIDAPAPQSGEAAGSIEQLKARAGQGSLAAQYDLGVRYQKGLGVEKDETEALKWYRLAGAQGDRSAQREAGVIAYDGKAGLRDYDEARRWFSQAAEQGDALAQALGGFMLANGVGGPKDEPKGAEWLRHAANKGNSKAQLDLADLHLRSTQGLEDDGEAVRWYRKAAEGGRANAQYMLGAMIVNGRGAAVDLAEAAKWFELAARSGHAAAQRQIAGMLAMGKDVPRNLPAARAWFYLAVVGGNEEAKDLLPKLDPMLSAEQMAEAERLTREYQAVIAESGK